MSEIDKKSIGLLFLAIFLDLLGFGIIIPILPYFTEYLGGTPVTLGWLLASYSITQFVFAPYFGGLSDRIGRRPVILIGLFGSTLAFVIFAFAQTLPMLFIARSVAGFFTSASLPTARAYIADKTPAKKRAHYFALIGIAFGLGFSFGPVIGSFMARYTIADLPRYAVASLFAASLTLINGLLALKFLPESLDKELRDFESAKRTRISLDQFRLVNAIPKLPILIVTFGTLSLAFSGFESMLPFYASALDNTIDAENIGYFYGLIGVVVIFAQGGLVRPLVKKYGEIIVIRIGLFSLFTGYILFPLAPLFNNVIIGIGVATIPMAIGMGILSPSLNAAISNRSPSSKQGMIMGFMSGVNSLMRAIGPVVAGLLFIIEMKLLFYVAALGMAILFVSMLTSFDEIDMEYIEQLKF